MRRFVVLMVLALSVGALLVVPGSAQAPPPPHEHVLMTPSGPIDVGPPPGAATSSCRGRS